MHNKTSFVLFVLLSTLFLTVQGLSLKEEIVSATEQKSSHNTVSFQAGHIFREDEPHFSHSGRYGIGVHDNQFGVFDTQTDNWVWTTGDIGAKRAELLFSGPLVVFDSNNEIVWVTREEGDPTGLPGANLVLSDSGYLSLQWRDILFWDIHSNPTPTPTATPCAVFDECGVCDGDGTTCNCQDYFQSLGYSNMGPTTCGDDITNAIVSYGNHYYRFILDHDSRVLFSGCLSQYDTTLSLYKCTTSIKYTDDDDDNCGSEPFSTMTSSIAATLSAGTYYWRIGGFSSSFGTYNIKIVCDYDGVDPSGNPSDK